MMANEEQEGDDEEEAEAEGNGNEAHKVKQNEEKKRTKSRSNGKDSLPVCRVLLFYSLLSIKTTTTWRKCNTPHFFGLAWLGLVQTKTVCFFYCSVYENFLFSV